MSLTEEDLVFIQDFRKEATASIQDTSPAWKQWNTNLIDDLNERYTQRRAFLLEELQGVQKQRLQLEERRQQVEQQIKEKRINLQTIGARDEMKRRKIVTEVTVPANRLRPYVSYFPILIPE